MRIRQLESILVDLPTIRAHRLANQTVTRLTLVVLRLRTDDGLEGLGEATTIGGLSYGEEAPETIKVVLDEYVAPLLVGQDAGAVGTLMASLAILVYRTPLGTAMRATAQNAQVAGLMGIDINRVIAVTFVIGAGLGAIAGVLYGTYYGIAQYTMGSILGLKAFSAAVLGGIGNIPGAMLGGVLLGLVEALGAGYIGDFSDLCRWGVPLQACERGGHFILLGSNYQDVFAFIVLILVLVFRPQGLLGERVGDRA